MVTGNIETLTKTLLAYNEEALAIYTKARETGVSGDFFSEVKPFADKVKQAAELWETAACDWVIQNKPKNLFVPQIKNTAENIQMVAVRAYFPESSFKNMKSHIESVSYVLKQLLDYIQVK